MTAKDPAAPQVPIIEHAHVKRMLLAQKAYVEGALAVAVVSGGQQSGDPGPRRLRLHPRIRRRAHYRDNRLNPIHEGTHGIQSLDLLGRKVTQRGGASLQALRVAVAATVAAAGESGGEAAELARHLNTQWQRLVAVTSAMFASGDIEAAMANSVVYLEAFGHVVIAWMWLE